MRNFLIFSLLFLACASAAQCWQLSLWLDGGILQRLFIGMDSLATDGFDAKMDMAAPPVPPVGFFPYIEFNDPQYSFITALWGDMRAPADSAKWQIMLRNVKVPVVMEWSADSMPPGYLAVGGKSFIELGGKYRVPVADTVFVVEYRRKIPPTAGIPGATAIHFMLASQANVQVIIADKEGNIIDIIYAGRLDAGEHSVVWNSPSGQGIYFYSVEADGNQIATGKIAAFGGK